MYNKFVEFMNDFLDEDASPDFWYDVASEEASQILLEFTTQDWDELLKNIDFQPLEFKRKLVYCLGDGEDKNQLRVILELISSDDDELFTNCVDSLRSFRVDQIKTETPDIVKMVENKIQEVGAPAKKIMKDFINKHLKLEQ